MTWERRRPEMVAYVQPRNGLLRALPEGHAWLLVTERERRPLGDVAVDDRVHLRKPAR